MPAPATLMTERLVLRPLVPADADALHPVFADIELMEFWSSPPHATLDETRAYVAENALQDRYKTWAITEGDEGAALGWVVLQDSREAVGELGYLLNRSHWGRGIAGEAVSAVIAHAFEALGYRRLWADTDPDNDASNRLLTYLGFRREGYLREEWETHIGVRDSVIWGLLAREWREREAADQAKA